MVNVLSTHRNIMSNLQLIRYGIIEAASNLIRLRLKNLIKYCKRFRNIPMSVRRNLKSRNKVTSFSFNKKLRNKSSNKILPP